MEDRVEMEDEVKAGMMVEKEVKLELEEEWVDGVEVEVEV